MKRSLRRLATVGATAAVALGMTIAIPAIASAATVGSLQVVPNTGDAGLQFSFKTSAACPAGSVSSAALIYGGPNNWDNIDGAAPVQLLGNNSIVDFTTPAPAAATIQAAALAKGKALAAGTYDLQLLCYSDTFGTVGGTFDGQLTLTADATRTVSGYRYDWVAPAAPASSATVTVPASASTGTPVTLSATVKATALAAGVTTSGTVQFKDGATVLATTPATVNVANLTNAATGVTVSATTTFTTAGAKSITATFVPADPTVVAGSTSLAASLNVAGVATATTTTLTASPTAPTTADVITLTAQVTPAAAGTVTFKDGATTVGTSTTDATGKATLSVTGATVGTHSATAAFTPADPTAFVASTSAAVSITVTTFSGYNLNGTPGGGETITATVPAGTLTLTALTTPVNLGTLALDSTNTRLVNPSPTSLNPVTVTDTRPGQLGYTVSGIAGDFTSGANKINSENLGWQPALSGSLPASMNVTAGPLVAPGDGVQVGVASSPVQGLKASRVLASSSYVAATNKGSIGTVQVTAALSIKAPTNTLPGSYTTTLVITAL
jgi:hypothetical protein